MVGFALKGSLIDYAQLAARAAHLQAAGLPLRIELHTFGPRDLYAPEGRRWCLANLDRLQDTFGPAELTVHIPFQDVNLVTEADFDAEQVRGTLAFATEAGAGQVVMHRYWGMVHGDKPPRCDRATATASFNETVIALAREHPDVALLVENMGHYFLASKKASDYLAGPLDHFFPWDIAAFRRAMADEGATNVHPFIDVAHATLTSNLFNHCRNHWDKTCGDPRFQGIEPSDLDESDRLAPFDFVDGLMPWLHVSDSLLADEGDPELGLAHLTSEGLEIGKGNLPFARLPEHLDSARADTVLLLEVEPGPGESYVENGAQYRSLDQMRSIFNGT